MRVLHIYKTYYPDSYGGVEQAIRQICFSTQKLGVTNRILALSKNPNPAISQRTEADVYRFLMNIEIASSGFSLSAFKGYQTLSKWADVIHYHFPWPFGDILHLSAKFKRPSIVTYHSDIVRQKKLLKLYRPLMNKFLTNVDAIIATSPNYLASSELLQRFHDKTSVIPIGLDESTYPAVKSNCLEMWREKLGDNFFLFVGVLRYYKGLHILLEAVQDCKIPVVIMGSGPTEAELKIRAQQLKLTNIHFLGSLPEIDKIALFQLSQAVVFPSHLRAEAFGISLLEGAMYGKPLISCEIGTGSSYINAHEVTGLVVPPSDPISLRKAIEKINANSTLRTDMGYKARLRFQQLFSAEDMAKQYIAIYKKLTGL
ncbi:D-rhamnosyltransferase WbpZ [soil metagenome]